MDSTGSALQGALEQLKICIISWNLGNKAPSQQAFEMFQNAAGHDVVVVGLQEATYPIKPRDRAYSAPPTPTEAPVDGETPEKPRSKTGWKSLKKGVTKALTVDIASKHKMRTVGAAAGFFLGGLVTFPFPPLGATIGAGLGAMAGTKVSEEAKSREHLHQFCQVALGQSFVPIVKDSLLQMRLLVFVRNTYAEEVAELETANEATGLGGVVGNKGALGVRFLLRGTSLCFVSCHLAAHHDKSKDRNQNTREILRGMRMGNKELDLPMQCDHMWWFGDLNYRLNYGAGDESGKGAGGKVSPYSGGETGWDECMRDIEAEDWRGLVRRDQLNQYLASRAVLCGFQEAEINFAPTFKMEQWHGCPYRLELDSESEDTPRHGSEASLLRKGPAETRPYIRKRIPSYCDRILRSSHPAHLARLRQTSYDSVPTVYSSDHTPVQATFELSVAPRSAAADAEGSEAGPAPAPRPAVGISSAPQRSPLKASPQKPNAKDPDGTPHEAAAEHPADGGLQVRVTGLEVVLKQHPDYSHIGASTAGPKRGVLCGRPPAHSVALASPFASSSADQELAKGKEKRSMSEPVAPKGKRSMSEPGARPAAGTGAAGAGGGAGAIEEEDEEEWLKDMGRCLAVVYGPEPGRREAGLQAPRACSALVAPLHLEGALHPRIQWEERHLPALPLHARWGPEQPAVDLHAQTVVLSIVYNSHLIPGMKHFAQLQSMELVPGSDLKALGIKLLGQCMVPLAPAVDAFLDASPDARLPSFEIPLVKYGREEGYVKGTYVLERR